MPYIQNRLNQQEHSLPHLLILIGLTFCLSLSLEFLPWPGWALRIKPLFPELALVYWVIHCPRIINYSAALLLGLILDIAAQLPLGMTAFSYTILVMLTNFMWGRFSLLGSVGQALHVFFILAVSQSVLLILKFLEASERWLDIKEQFSWNLYIPSVAAAILWLFLPLLMRQLSGIFKRNE